jgi:hypothetical protein
LRRLIAAAAVAGVVFGTVAVVSAQEATDPPVDHVTVRAGEGLWAVARRVCPGNLVAQFQGLQAANPWLEGVQLHPGTVLHFTPLEGCQVAATTEAPATTDEITLPPTTEVPTSTTTTTVAPTTTGTVAPTSTAPPATTTTSSVAPSTTTAPTTTSGPNQCPEPRHEPGGSDGMGGCWPGEFNTGVPEGVTLTPYTGSYTISSGTFDARQFNGTVTITGPVTITRSQINGTARVQGAGRLTISDSNIHAAFNTSGFLTSNSGGVIGDRLEITGGNRSGFCDPCTLRDSFVHGQETELPAHASGVRASQNSTLIHNVLWCEPQNCSANLTGYPDFEPTQHWLIQRNLFMSGPGPTFCAFGGNSDGKPFSDDPTNAMDILFYDNVFKRDLQPQCGALGSIVAFESKSGNVWQGNVWADDGSPVPPRD